MPTKYVNNQGYAKVKYRGRNCERFSTGSRSTQPGSQCLYSHWAYFPIGSVSNRRGMGICGGGGYRAFAITYNAIAEIDEAELDVAKTEEELLEAGNSFMVEPNEDGASD